jgi:hypothetical protein
VEGGIKLKIMAETMEYCAENLGLMFFFLADSGEKNKNL